MKIEKPNSLAVAMPDLAKEWHPTKNGDLLPTDVSCWSEQKVWWLFPYTDLETGKYFEFEWQCSVHNRTMGSGCPFIAGQRVWPGFNDLATKRPDIATQWHPVKNGDLKPSDVTEKSGQSVWWFVPYDDPRSGQHFDFEWEATVSNRTRGQGGGCPYLSGKAVYKGFNDLATLRSDLAKEWHPTKNGSLTPFDVPLHYGKKVWWYLPYDDPQTGHHDFEWEATVDHRVGHDVKCPYLSNKAVWVGYNDLETTHPDIAKKFHPTKNGKLTTKDFTYGSGKIVWWLHKHYDSKTNKWFDLEWKACVRDVVRMPGECPQLSGKLVQTGFNDLATLYPDIAKDWHYAKNKNLKPTDVTASSNKKVWWIRKHHDTKTNRNWVFEWQTTINARTSNPGDGCPYLSGKIVMRGFNDLATTHPHLVKEWHPTKNGQLTPFDITAGSGKRVWWLLPYDDPITGKHFNFEWETDVVSRANNDTGCPYLSNYKILPGFNDLETTHPHLAEQWHPTKNGYLNPRNIHAGYSKAVWWYLPYDDPITGRHFNFEWQSSVNNRARQNLQCPYLSNQKLWKGFNDLESMYPELAADWHPTKNGTLKPCDVMPGSAQKVWWKKTIDGKEYEWATEVRYRMHGGLGLPDLNIKSILELHVQSILNKKNIKHNYEVTFEDLKTPRNWPYRYDFGAHDLSWLIECDGEQHFRFSDYYYKSKDEFNMRVEYDNVKNTYAALNNIPLLRIPYSYSNNINKIEEFIDYFLSTKMIPEEIIQFYKEFELSNYTNKQTT